MSTGESHCFSGWVETNELRGGSAHNSPSQQQFPYSTDRNKNRENPKENYDIEFTQKADMMAHPCNLEGGGKRITSGRQPDFLLHTLLWDPWETASQTVLLNYVRMNYPETNFT